MTKTPKLTIELVPEGSWYNNVRSKVPKAEWDDIRRKVYAAAKYVCQICGGKGLGHPVEAHEIWEYDDKKHVQKLVGFQALCPDCHEVKHIGLAQIRGRYKRALDHLMKINSWNCVQAERYVDEAMKKWVLRSGYLWVVDISELRGKP